ncbi:MauE/DoxX family redox-associated membrane protein [Amycolatopsis anabasis]|uniref:MauE/DoxX family redox-associated membrane protein n=1 Tax=Amycolatopsis anabasis TaxID=1840409 RepID=UPI00131E7F19|nr:MauE/DoxX family redox-associated membrane protein [Amycolatopsis anabasis]
MDTVLLLVRLLLAAVFALSGGTKLADHAGTREAMLDFGVPARFAAPAAAALPVAELAVAVALVPPASARIGAFGALVLLLVFTSLLAYHLAHGRAPACRCFGRLSAEPPGWPALARNLVLAALATTVLFGPVTGFTVDARTVALGLLLAGGAAFFALWQRQEQLRRRLAELECKLAERPAATTRPRAPAFRLPNLAGTVLDLEALLASGNPALLVFANPDCGACDALLPDLGRWHREHRLTVAVISRGAAGPNRARADRYGLPLILLQRDREVADAYRAAGTPCAVLVHPDGTLDGRPVYGPERIRTLVSSRFGSSAAVADGRRGSAADR